MMQWVMEQIDNTCACWSAAARARSCWPRALRRESPDKFWPISLFIMEKLTLMSACLCCFRAVTLLLLVTCSVPLVASSRPASNAPRSVTDFAYPYDSIFSPLVKALSEHGGSRWSPGLKKKIKPEHRYMKYLTEVYKKSSGAQRSVDGHQIYNTVRLIKPQDECLAQSNKGEPVTQTAGCTHWNQGSNWGSLSI